jgi:hypothetical protein
MALPETNQKPVSPFKSGENSNFPDAAQQPQQPPHPTPTEVLSKSRDPRQLGADLADKYLHVGSQLGFALFVVWGIIALATIPTLVIGVGLIPAAIFNMLLFSPKTVYRISEFILDFCGFGEVLQAADEVGLDKVTIKISDWQKGLILFYDIIVALVIILFISIVLISLCSVANSTVGKVAGKAASVVSPNSAYATISSFCSSTLK